VNVVLTSPDQEGLVTVARQSLDGARVSFLFHTGSGGQRWLQNGASSGASDGSRFGHCDSEAPLKRQSP
jgi:hypothetical protein